MADFSLPNIFKLIVMILLAVALAMLLLYDDSASFNMAYLVIAGGLIVYITFVVALCTEAIDSELTQFTDLIAMGPSFGMGLYWTASHADHTDGNGVYALIMGIVMIFASVFMLLSAIFTK